MTWQLTTTWVLWPWALLSKQGDVNQFAAVLCTPSVLSPWVVTTNVTRIFNFVLTVATATPSVWLALQHGVFRVPRERGSCR